MGALDVRDVEDVFGARELYALADGQQLLEAIAFVLGKPRRLQLPGQEPPRRLRVRGHLALNRLLLPRLRAVHVAFVLEHCVGLSAPI